MKFRTEIKNERAPFEINHKNNIFLLGSCFSDNISDKLQMNKFKSFSNPFGIVYNPISITKIITRIVNKNYPDEKEFRYRNELWHHFEFHGSMSGEFLNEVSEKVNIWIDHSHLLLKQADVIFITYGTSIVHHLIENNQIVANNHKFPADFFTKRRLEVKEISKSIEELIDLIHRFNSKVKIVFTISPVRHIKSGLIENQRSKAALILAVEETLKNNKLFYFPAYELILDDLRDYRYYNSDLVHPSSEAIEYIWEKFSETFFNEETIQKNTEIEKLMKSFEHKPFNLDSKSHQLFLKKLKEKVSVFCLKNPEISFDEELKRLK